MPRRPINLLFVCTANVCRSPLAAGLMAYNAKHVGIDVRVSSAGTDREIRDTHATTLKMLAERGVSLGRNKSQPITNELIDGADLVLAMTAEHARSVVGRFPKSRKKVFLLEHLTTETGPLDRENIEVWLKKIHTMRRDYSRSDKWDIQDPIKESDAIYDAVEVQIDNATMWLATVISTLADK